MWMDRTLMDRTHSTDQLIEDGKCFVTLSNPGRPGNNPEALDSASDSLWTEGEYILQMLAHIQHTMPLRLSKRSELNWQI